MTTIPLRPLSLRLFFVLALAAGTGLLGWKLVRAALGDSIMTYARLGPNLATEARLAGADEAIAYAPNDPLLHWQRGLIYLAAAETEQSAAQLNTALSDLRAAVGASPADYRLRLALGRVLERSGAMTEARAELELATQLAPNHFEPHWALGNHLLRNGVREASFAALRQALVNRPAALPLIFDYAWAAFGGDARALLAALQPTALPLQTRAEVAPQLAQMLIMRSRVAEALALWRETPPHSAADTQKIIAELLKIGRADVAYETWRASPLGTVKPDEGSLLANGGFEQKLALNEANPFLTWRIEPSAALKVTLDSKEPAAGKLSLRAWLELAENSPLFIAAQTVPVKPATAYRLSFAAKTEEMQSLSAPFVVVFDMADQNRVQAASAPFPNGTQDWRTYQLDFTTSAATESVTVRVQRMPCPEPPCPLTGRVWLDEFKLSPRAGGAAKP